LTKPKATHFSKTRPFSTPINFGPSVVHQTQLPQFDLKNILVSVH
jgi:hypothetical protein